MEISLVTNTRYVGRLNSVRLIISILRICDQQIYTGYRKRGLDVNINIIEYIYFSGKFQDVILDNGQSIRYSTIYKHFGAKVTDDEAIKQRNIQRRTDIANTESYLKGDECC